jgi:hypothetical protein
MIEIDASKVDSGMDAVKCTVAWVPESGPRRTRRSRTAAAAVSVTGGSSPLVVRAGGAGMLGEPAAVASAARQTRRSPKAMRAKHGGQAWHA